MHLLKYLGCTNDRVVWRNTKVSTGSLVNTWQPLPVQEGQKLGGLGNVLLT